MPPPTPRRRLPVTAPICILQTHDEQEYDYAILLLGSVGVGKSTLCNFFFGEEIFESESGVISVTSNFNAHCCSINGKRIMFIDSPGFSDTIMDNNTRMQEMGKALLSARNGVHAILFCMNGEQRFSQDVLSLLNEMKKLEINEPQSIWAYTFVVFTHGRSMGKTETQRNEKVLRWQSDSKCPPLFQELLSKVQNRYMIVESLMEKESYTAGKYDELVRFIEMVYADNNKTCYTHRLFAWARDKYEEAMKIQIEKQTVQQEKVINSQVELLKENNDLIKQLENDKKELSTKMEEIKNELFKAEMQLKDNESKISRQEAEINSIQENETIKIKDAMEKLEKAKNEKREFEELVEKKQKECSENAKVIKEKQTDIENEKQSKQEIEGQLQEERRIMAQLKEIATKSLSDRQIEGNPETLNEALRLMTQDIDRKQEQLTEKGDEVKQLTKHIESYCVFGFPISTNRKFGIGFAPIKQNIQEGDQQSST